LPQPQLESACRILAGCGEGNSRSVEISEANTQSSLEIAVNGENIWFTADAVAWARLAAQAESKVSQAKREVYRSERILMAPRAGNWAIEAPTKRWIPSKPLLRSLFAINLLSLFGAIYSFSLFPSRGFFSPSLAATPLRHSIVRGAARNRRSSISRKRGI
jgi:hypothetical protein